MVLLFAGSIGKCFNCEVKSFEEFVGPANDKLKAQGRTNLANGISLDVTDDLQG